MGNDRLPKIIYSELKDGARSRDDQRNRYKDTLKANLKQCSIVPADPKHWYWGGLSGDQDFHPTI